MRSSGIHRFAGHGCLRDAPGVLAQEAAGNAPQHGPEGSWLYTVSIPGFPTFQGEKDEAFQWLNRAYDARSYLLAVYLNTDARLDVLRSDPRFAKLRQSVGLPALH